MIKQNSTLGYIVVTRPVLGFGVHFCSELTIGKKQYWGLMPIQQCREQLKYKLTQ